MTFALGAGSESKLVGVRPKLVCCVRYAIKRTVQDFSVFEGVRSDARQRALYASGASRTLDSYHLTGEAVDLVPYVEGVLQWQQPLCNKIAAMMLEASRVLSVRLVWGSVWDRELASLDPDNLAGEVADYAERYRSAHPGKHALIDGPHFELVRGQDAIGVAA